MNVLELHHIALLVKDVELLNNFYTQVLGFHNLDRPNFDFEGAWIKLGAHQELHLIGNRTTEIIHSDSRSNHFAVRVEDINEVEALLISKKLEFRGPKKRPDGAFQIFVKDPEGNTMEFTQID